jgi:hypothetical protein
MPLMFIIVAVNTQKFPVAAVRGIVVMVMILMVNGEFAKSFAFELAPATATNMWKHLERPFTVALHSLFLLSPDFGNELTIIIGYMVWRHKRTFPPASM